MLRNTPRYSAFITRRLTLRDALAFAEIIDSTQEMRSISELNGRGAELRRERPVCWIR
jgi:hypothetical protein